VSRKWWRPTGWPRYELGKGLQNQNQEVRFLVQGFEDETVDFDFDLILNYQVHPPLKYEQESSNPKVASFFSTVFWQLIGSTFGAAKLQDEASALGGGPSFSLGWFRGGNGRGRNHENIMKAQIYTMHIWNLLSIQYTV